MTRRLQVNVQVDRLPDGPGGAAQLGLSLSTAIDTQGTSPAQPGDDALVLPWRWRATGGAADWNPHDAGSWRLWRIAADGTVTDETGWTVKSGAPGGFDATVPDADAPHAPRRRFRSRLDAEVADILAACGPHALEAPRPGEAVSTRTVMGLVESLTGLPHPAPSGMNVWAAVELGKPVTDGDRFVAAPVFAAYAPADKALPAADTGAGGFWHLAYAPGPAVEGRAYMRPSLKQPELAIAATDTQRLIDATTLLIRHLPHEEVEGTDWSSDLLLRLSEAIDPGLRAAQALEGMLADPRTDSATAALRRDLVKEADGTGGRDRFRAALWALTKPALRPRARGSRAAPAPAVAFFESLAAREPALWADAAPTLLALAGAEPQGALPAEPPFVTILQKRLATAAGLDPAAVAPPAADEGPDISTEAGLQAWLEAYWTAGPRQADPIRGQSRFVQVQDRLLPPRPPAKATLFPEEQGLIDLQRMRGTRPLLIELRFEVKETLAKGAEIVLTLERPNSPPTAPRIILTLTAQDAAVDLALAHGGARVQAASPHAFAPGPLVLQLSVPALDDGAPAFSATAVFGGATAGPVGIGALAAAGRLGLAVAAPATVPVILQPGGALPTSTVRERLQGQAWRPRLAAARYGAAAAGLLAGWIEGRDAEPAWAGMTLRGRIEAATKAYVAAAFLKAFDDAAKAVGLDDSALAALWDRLRVAAQDSAVEVAAGLVPAARSDLDRVTEDALPLSFAIDQLGGIDAEEDLWSRLAGVGVLLGRADPTGAWTDEWWSLNAATLHVTGLGGVRGALGLENAVPAGGAARWPDSWARAARVDPVPLVVGETNGSRSVVIRYESRSLVAEVQGSFQAAAAGPGRIVARRPEAYLFPTKPGLDGALKLPPLTFGRSYAIVPYAIGHGGVMPPALRSVPADPTSGPPQANAATGSVRVAWAALGSGVVREARYRRTTPIGAPGLLPDGSEQWPVPEDVASVFEELPRRLPPVTVRPGAASGFFFDPQGGGTLWPGSQADGVLIRIPLARGAANPRLQVRITDEKGDVLTLDMPVGTPDADGLEIEVVGQAAWAWALRWPPESPAEDEPTRKKDPIGIGAAAREVALWRGAGVKIAVDGGDVLIEPPMAWWTTMQSGRRVWTADRPLHPAEAKPAIDNLLLLDGIAWGVPRPRQARLTFARPVATHANYDRWINGPLGGYGAAKGRDVADALRKAEKVAASPSPNEVLPDPAVTALVMEVVRLFPLRRVEFGPKIVRRYREEPPSPGAPGAAESGGDGPFKLVVAARPMASGDAEKWEAETAKWEPKTEKLTLPAGGVYELRIYGAMPDAQPAYAPAGAATRDRFSLAAAASLRGETLDDGAHWWLGAARVVPIEVAWDQMPDFSGDPDRPGFTVVLDAPAGTGRGAQISLRPSQIDYDKDPVPRYARLRSVNRMELLEQAWDWRGFPMPELAESPGPFGDGPADPAQTQRVDPAVRAYVAQAFLWRDDEDRLRETSVRLQRAQVYSGRDVWNPAEDAFGARLLTRTLPWGGGATLWRLAVRATSRYAAMRGGSGRLERRSHKVEGRSTTWWPLVLRDRIAATPRPLGRPALLMVVPLTEPLMECGTIPPLLALFNEPMHPRGNAGDGIEAVIEVARHPLTARDSLNPEGGDRASLEAEAKTLQEARNAVDAAQAALDRLLRFAAHAAPRDVTAATEALNRAKDAQTKSEAAFAEFYAKAVARGLTARWRHIVEKDLGPKIVDGRQRLAEASAAGDHVLADALRDGLARLEAREVAAKASLDAAKEAEKTPDPTPLAGLIPDPVAKLWQEVAPDPVRTAAAAGGEPVALRCDGPIGYTFDLEGLSGRFDHAGLLVSPVQDRVRPYSFVKLRFRRVEAPELAEDAVEVHAAGSAPHDLGQARAFTLARLEQGSVTLRFQLQHKKPGVPFVQVEAARVGERLDILGSTELGGMRRWSLPVRKEATVELRVIAAARPRPEGKRYRPGAEISVQVRIGKPPANLCERLSEGAWLFVACLPLSASAGKEDEIDAGAFPTLWSDVDQAGSVEVRPIRVSDFTPGAWCQFTAAMSRVRIEATLGPEDGGRAVAETIDIAKLSAVGTAVGDGLTLRLHGKRLQEVALTAEGAPDETSQLEEKLYLVATRTAFDASDRLRERPVAIFEVPGGMGEPVLKDPVWPLPQPGGPRFAPFASGEGRLRVLHVLRGRTREEGGFAEGAPVFPFDFFGKGTEGDPEWPDDPPDAAGQVLGISPPFCWKASSD